MVGGSFTVLLLRMWLKNPYFRQKHLQIKISESSSEKILTVLLSWTVLHYTDNLIGCKKKWQFEIKGFKWESLPVSKLVFLKKQEDSGRHIFNSLISCFVSSVFHAEIAPSDEHFNGSFCKRAWTWREEIKFIFLCIHLDTHIEMPILWKFIHWKFCYFNASRLLLF